MKRLFVFSYPKLTLYVIAIVVAYFVFQIPSVLQLVTSFGSLFYLSIFFAGLLYSAGFTTPIATGFFLAINPIDIYHTALIGAVGALIADIGIFSFIKISFMDEFKLLRHSSFIRHIYFGVNMIIPKNLRKFLVYLLVVIIIASPLPDELGVALLAGFTKVHPYGFVIMSYIGNFLGIFLLLII